VPRTFLAQEDPALRIRGGKRRDDDRNRKQKENSKRQQQEKSKDDDRIAMAIAEAESMPSTNNNETHIAQEVNTTAATRQSLNILFANSMESLLPKLQILQRQCSRFGPSVVAIMALIAMHQHGQFQNGTTFFNLYGLALVGASCGFSLFLYFITVGFALGVTLPMAVSLWVYQKHCKLPRLTIVHSVVTILWGLRLVTFLLWREYISWPALHEKVVEVQAKMNIPFASKLLCWVVYSFFYVALMASNWSRLLQSASLSLTADPTVAAPSLWGIFGIVGLVMQSTGLILVTVADAQKNAFKSRYHFSWCNVGLWKFSTHPNYLGDGLFWIGTYLAHGFHSIIPSALATCGLIFIMVVLKGASRSLASKQKEKYGQTPGFLEFQRSHNVFGPKHWWVRSGNTTLDDTPVDSNTTATSSEGDNIVFPS
jgi:steroid 5-alpha reductase family enzyme